MDNSSSVTDSPVNDLTDILRQIDFSSTMSIDIGGGRGYSSRLLILHSSISSVFGLFILSVADIKFSVSLDDKPAYKLFKSKYKNFVTDSEEGIKFKIDINIVDDPIIKFNNTKVTEKELEHTVAPIENNIIKFKRSFNNIRDFEGEFDLNKLYRIYIEIKKYVEE